LSSSKSSESYSKSYYLNYENFVDKPEENKLFEPEENHYLLYKTDIKDEEPFIKIIP